MQAYLTLTRRELASFFVSMTGYVIIAAALFLIGLSFVVLLVKLQSEPTPMPMLMGTSMRPVWEADILCTTRR